MKLKKLVKIAIIDYMWMDMAFTSVDICNNIRSNNPTLDVRMSKISNILRKHVISIGVNNNYQYDCSLIHIDNSNKSWTYLYHPRNFDPNCYMIRDQKPLQTINT